MKRLYLYTKSLNPESIIWSAALVFLAIIGPGTEQHFSICPLHNLGLGFCPGCGLGRSISLLFRGDLSASFEMHYLGIPVAIALTYRIIFLVKLSLKNYQYRLEALGE